LTLLLNYKTKLNGHSGYDGIGFIFSPFDPYCGIDLDYTDDPAKFERQQLIYSNFNSYSELSPSGKGLHIICKGEVPAGRKREKIEVYSSGRYFTFTGAL
jgi:putative DNA primase/helicase